MAVVAVIRQPWPRARAWWRALVAARHGRLARWSSGLRSAFPLTSIGAGGLVALGITWKVAWSREQDYLLFMVAKAGLALVALLALLVVLTALLLRRRLKSARTPEALRLETGAWQPTGFRVAVPRWLPCVEVTWEVLDPGGHPLELEVMATRENGFLAESVLPRHRGWYRGLRRRFLVRDILGVASIRLEVAESTPARILPSRSGLEGLPPLVALLASDEISDPRGEPFGDRVDMRQYVRGDPPRLILWKVFARTRKLMVRVPERAITAQPRTCAWLVPGPHDEAAASIARVVLERGLLGDGWRFGADCPLDPADAETKAPSWASHVQEALDLVARSGDSAPPASPAPRQFQRFLERAEHDGYMCCIVFAPPGCGSWMDDVEEATRRSRLRVYAFMGVESMQGAPPRPRWQRLLTLAPPAATGVPREELGRAFDRWHGVASAVFAVERGTGRLMDGLARGGTP